MSLESVTYWREIVSLFKHYPQLECLNSFRFSVQKPAQGTQARIAPLHDHNPLHDHIPMAWRPATWMQNRDTYSLLCFTKHRFAERTMKDFGAALVFEDVEVNGKLQEATA